MAGIQLALSDWRMNFANDTKSSNFEEKSKKQSHFLRSALIVGYILAVLLFAGLARANWNKPDLKIQSLEEALTVHRIA